MNKLRILVLGFALVAISAVAGTPSDADQKWLGAVEKMVEQGKTEVSTTSNERVELAKNWAGKNGFKTEVKKTGDSYKVTFSKSLASK